MKNNINMGNEMETVIGLEVHVQLATKTKLFCACSAEYSAEANVNVCPVCAGHLGALPVFNEQALEFAIKAGKALNCTINKRSMFDRKNYFYPDLPKGYQISQFYYPYAEHGYIDLESGKRIKITRIHIEEDAGKLIHDELKRKSYVDMNRCSVPLIEIVSYHNISSASEAHEYLSKLKNILKYTEVSDVSMELGSLRCDANVSVRRKGEGLGTRVEIKNLNSFKAISKAIEYEHARQVELIERGEAIVLETRLWDENRLVTKSMRTKESAHGYRYFPDPDLLPIEVSQEYIDSIELPELPKEKLERFINQYSIPKYDAEILTTEIDLAKYFEEAALVCGNAKSVSNWIMTEVIKDQSFPIKAKYLGEMIKMIDSGLISGKIAKELYVKMLTDKRDPRDIVKDLNLVQIQDESFIQTIVDDILNKNASSIEEYRAGKTRVLGFLVGQIMKESKGKANPELVNKLLLEKLEK